jgi:hypothetical protein
MSRPDHFIPLKPADYKAIGRVAMEWTAIEGLIAVSVRTLLDRSDNVGRTVTANTQFLTNCDILRALLHLRFSNRPEVQRICKLIEDLSLDKPNHDDHSKRKSPRTRRNEIIHGSWVATEHPRRVYTLTYKAKGKLKYGITLQSAKKVEAFADELGSLCGQLFDEIIPLLEPFAKAR